MTDKINDKNLNPQILRMKKIAEDNGGTLLDMEWRGSRVIYNFIYDKNDKLTKFVRTARVLFEQGWPDYKNNKTAFLKQKTKNKSCKEKLAEMEVIALNNKAKLLSEEWISTTTKYEFLVDSKTVFISYQYLIKKNWPKNINFFVNPDNQKKSKLETQKQRYEQIKSLSSKYNFQLLSPNYQNRDSLLKFLNNDTNEIFFMSYKSIVNGMLENQSIGKRGLIAEPICKQALEHLFGYKFIKRVDILTPKVTGRKKYLELDGYCEELKIAFEYQGHQSHWDINHFNYIKVSEKDKVKEKFCKQLGIVLLPIPNFGKNKTFFEEEILQIITQIIEKRFSEENKLLPFLNKGKFVIDYEKINHAKYMIEKMRNLAKENGVELISKKWLGSQEEYEFKKEDKVFKIRYCKLEEKGWPKNLAKFLSLSDGHKKTNEQLIEEIQNYAKENNLILIDKQWVNIKHKHIFQSTINNNRIELSKSQINRILNKSVIKEKQAIKKNLRVKQNDDKNLLKLQSYAKENNAELLSNKWEGRQAYYNFKINEKIISFKGEYLSKKGWPKDLETYIKQSKSSKAGHQNRE